MCRVTELGSLGGTLSGITCMHLSESTQRSRLDVQWRDLVPMTRLEKLWELSLSLPWFVGALFAYQFGYIAIGVVCSVYFFLTGLRQSHCAQHYSLGLPKGFQDGVLFALSACMLASMHAVQASHLHHHRHCLEAHDAEGATARLKWWQAIIVGPLFIWRLHLSAWGLSPGRKRRWIVAEMVTVAAVVICAILARDFHGLRWHVAAMAVGECLTGFFAVWTVHRGCDTQGAIARTQRGHWVNRLSYGMFYHSEHHLFPLVPTCHLGTLAERIDRASSEFADQQVMQFDTVKPPNKPAAGNAGIASQLTIGLHRPGVPEPGCSASKKTSIIV